MVDVLDSFIKLLTDWAPAGTYLSYAFVVRGLLAIILVSLVCGSVGSLVVGNRMSFFSDALAHCMFAGAALGVLVGLGIGAQRGGTFYQVGVPLIMVVLGAFMGLGIALVRERTGLSNDTVIGVFFALSIGLGAVLFNVLARQAFASPEQFLFGDPTAISTADLVMLVALACVTFVLLLLMSNQLMFTTFNISLARSRNVPVTLCNAAFIILLSLIVNLSLRTVGALLINALLIVPAAAAANVSRNMRQMFWISVLISLTVGVGGYLGCLAINHRLEWDLGQAGFIVLLAVAVFGVSMVIGPALRGQRPAVSRGG
jgi:zinc transport system permease protein